MELVGTEYCIDPPHVYQLVSPSDKLPMLSVYRTPVVIHFWSVRITLFGIAGASLLTFLATSLGLSLLKPISLLMLLLAGTGTVSLYLKYGAAIHGRRALISLFLLSILPFLRIAFEVVPTYETKKITDGLFIFGPYYLLPFSALGILAFLASTSVPFDVILRRSLLPIMLLIVFFTPSGSYTLDPSQPVGIYTVYNNLIIPIALLLFFPIPRSNLVMGMAALCALLVMSTLQGSRAYILVFLYLSLFKLVLSGSRRDILFLRIASLVFLVAISGTFAVQFLLVSASDATIVQKLKLDTLLPLVRNVWQSGDLLLLFFWEGNSRSSIIVDAFSDFSGWEFIWGRGVTGSYVSFTTRTTIEIGHAQELFWLGLVTLIPTFAFTFVSLFGVLRRRKWRTSALGRSLMVVALVRILDGFIFGMPVISLYTLFFWMFVMQYALKKSLSARAV